VRLEGLGQLKKSNDRRNYCLNLVLICYRKCWRHKRKLNTLWGGPIGCHIFSEFLPNNSFQSQLRSFDKWIPTFMRNPLPPFSGSRLKTEAVGFSETLVKTYKTSRRHIIAERSSHLAYDSPFLRFIVIMIVYASASLFSVRA
jgi:hypothetical protein